MASSTQHDLEDSSPPPHPGTFPWLSLSSSACPECPSCIAPSSPWVFFPSRGPLYQPSLFLYTCSLSRYLVSFPFWHNPRFIIILTYCYHFPVFLVFLALFPHETIRSLQTKATSVLLILESLACQAVSTVRGLCSSPRDLYSQDSNLHLLEDRHSLSCHRDNRFTTFLALGIPLPSLHFLSLLVSEDPFHVDVNFLLLKREGMSHISISFHQWNNLSILGFFASFFTWLRSVLPLL